MTWKKATPGKGKRAHAESFSYTRVPPSTKTWTGWMAGEPYWCEAHEHTKTAPGTKVCLEWFTDGELKCPRCRYSPTTSTVCYVPIYREADNKPVFVIVHESVADFIAELKWRDEVYVGRVDEASSIFVRKCATQTPFASGIESRQKPCDLSASLLTVWGYPMLTAWVIANANKPTPKPPATALAGPMPAPEVKHAKGPLERLKEAEDRARAEDDNEKMRIGSTMDFILNGKVPKNGRPKPKG